VPLLGWIALAIVPPGGVLISRAFYKWCDNRRKRQLYTQFPDALAMIVRGVRVGIPVTEAIRTVAREAMAPTNSEFQKMSDQLSIGVALPDALREMSERNDLPEYRFFATALALQSQTGGGLSETLENLADVIRKRVALRSRAYALASEARTSIYILAALPVFAGLALAALNPDYMSLLFTTDSGKKVFAAALCSLGVGIGVMQTIVKKTLS
jgi:tight adherence protein B